MLQVQRPIMETYSAYDVNDSQGPRTRFRAASIDSDLSYNSTNSSSVASSTRVHPRSIYSISDIPTETDDSANSVQAHPRYSVSDTHTLTEESANSVQVHPRYSVSDTRTETEGSVNSIEVHLPESPNDYAHRPDQYDTIAVNVLCLYDFDSDDPDHTPFKKNDILLVIKQEPSGWWAAESGDRVGWIPSAFVVVISPEMAQILKDVSYDLRVYEYEAEKLYSGTPMAGLDLGGEAWPLREQFDLGNDDVQVVTTSYPLSPNGFPTDVTPATTRLFEIPTVITSQELPLPGFLTDPRNSTGQTPHLNVPRTPRTPVPPNVPAPAPSSSSSSTSISHSQENSRHPLPQLKLNTTPLMINKPTPPTPISPTSFSSQALTPPSNYSPSPVLPRSYSLGSSSASIGSSASSSSRPRLDPSIYSPGSAKNLKTLLESPRLLSENPSEIDLTLPHGSPHPRRHTSARGKVWQITGDDNAQAFHNARKAQAQLPWYLKPEFTGDQIELDHDGSVKAGTLKALVERLTIEPLKVEQEKTYRHTFLTTFHAFTTAETLLELLIQRYEMDPPINIAEEQFREWIEKKFQPTQARVLHVFTVWVEEYGMVEDDPHIISRLREFLSLINTPVQHAKAAKNVLQVIELRQQSDINLPSLASSAPSRRIVKRHRNDLLKIDHGDLARQLTLYEVRLYLKIRPHECLTWGSNQRGDSVRNLRTFVSTSDKLASWVKMSVLNNDALGKRADTIELWIKVAEKCRALNNFSSMSAIIAALTSQVIAKLQLTWAHVNRASHIEPLVKLSEPTGNFTAYRSLFSSVEGPCLPYIGIYLSDMVKVSETSPNFVKSKFHSVDLVPTPTSDLKLINVLKCQKMEEVAHTIVRHQPKVRDEYRIPENTSVLEFVENQLRIASEKDEGTFWMRSQAVQHAELSHADIRKGLEAAGF